MTAGKHDYELWAAAFEAYLHHQEKEESTIRLYLAEIEHFFRDLYERGHKTVAEVKADDLLVYRNVLLEKRMKASTINKRMSVLSTFYRWAEQYGYAEQAATAQRLRIGNRNKTIIRWLGEDEVKCLFSTISKEKNKFRRARNEALIAVMLYAGLRVEEVSRLRLNSFVPPQLIVFDNNVLKRSIPVDIRLLVPFMKWFSVRQRLGRSIHQESNQLFVTERSGYMQPRAVQFVVEHLAEQTGFPVTCQILRHTYCRRLAKQGVNAEQIRKWAGHKSLMTTFQYFEWGK